MCTTSGAKPPTSSAAADRPRRPSRWSSYQGQRTEPRRATVSRPPAVALRPVVEGASSCTAWPRSARPRASSLVTVGTPPTIGSYWSVTISTRSGRGPSFFAMPFMVIAMMPVLSLPG